jgi:hypothetical protein
MLNVTETLALAAMALQLALSFGHFHINAANDGTTAVAANSAGAPASAPFPAQHPANDADDYCAICAVIHLTATSLIPQLPLLSVPFVSKTVEHFSHVAFTFIALPLTPFQSRAPPLA